MLNNFCFHLYAQNSLSNSQTLSHSLTLTLTLSHSHTLSISHSITLDMLNIFCFQVYAQKSLFIAENCNVFFRPFYVPRINTKIWHMTASVDTANVEREFSKQNLILTSLRNRTLISNMSKKVCNKGYLQALSDDVTEGILNSAAIRFKNMKKRRQFKLVRK